MKICIVIPYFGKFPNYFNLFLNSCAYNETIDWLIFTDDKTNYDYPSNVKVIYITFQEIKDKIQRKFDFEISLEKPYKLCDYRPAYGYIFEEYLNNYNFWGYCDVDLVFGDIRKFYTNEILQNYDKIGHMGHLSLYKNNDDINFLFAREINSSYRYKEVFSKNNNLIFDEWDYPSINHIFLNYKKKIFCEDCAADLYPNDSFFNLIYFDLSNMKWHKMNKNCVIHWNNGKVIVKWKDNGHIFEKECIYAHFQKRKLILTDIDDSSFYVIPNKVVSTNCNLDKIRIICLAKRVFNFRKWKSQYVKLKYLLIVKTSPFRHPFRQ